MNFRCPQCGRNHCEETVDHRGYTCFRTGKPVWFDERFRPFVPTDVDITADEEQNRRYRQTWGVAAIVSAVILIAARMFLLN
jgi:hypothetical protein